jgi:guanine deaminase
VSELVVRGGRVWDRDRERWRDLDIQIHGGRIVEVAPPSLVSDRPSLEATGCLVVPGLVNAHTHAHNNLLKGTGDCRWLEAHIAAMSAVGSWSPDDLYLSTMVGALEMLATGTTAAYDMVRAPTDEHVAAVVQAYDDVGMRAVIAPAVADIPFYEAIPGLADLLPVDERRDLEASTRLPDAEAAAAFAARALSAADRLPGERVRMAVGPLIADSCSDDLLRRLAELAQSADAPLHMHLLESKLQALNGLTRGSGRPWVVHLAALGALAPRSTFAHAVWLTDEETAVLADAGASVAHNPASNLKLGSGLAPVADYRRHGVNVAVATDGAASGDSQDMFAAMWLTALVNHARTPDPSGWLSAAEVFEMATVAGSAALGLPSGAGEIRVGAPADLALVALDSARLRPVNDPSIALVYGGAGACVRSVVVDGEVVLRDGRATRVDSDELLERAERAAHALGTASRETEQTARVTDLMRDVQSGLADRPFPIDRYAARADGYGG